MTEIYRVAADASLESVRLLLGQQRARRVALELPEGWLELDSVARMRLLQRQAQVQQCELALITRNPATRSAAAQVGVPVFARAEDAAGGRWHMNPHLPLIDPHRPAAGLPEPPPWRRTDEIQRIARPSFFKTRQRRIQQEKRYRSGTPAWLRWAGNLLIGALIAAVLGAFALYVLPAATITMTPGRLPLRVDVAMTAVAGLTAPDVANRQLPARLIQADLEERGAVVTSGTAQKSTDRAVGEVVFSNLGNTPVNIPTGTSVSTSSGTPVEFRTVRDALLESGVGTRVTVPVEAVEPGTAGNVRSNTINTVSGALRFRVRVNNLGGTFGGGSQLVPVVTQADRDVLVGTLQERAEARAYEALVAKLEPGEWLPPESVQTFVIAQSFDQYNDEEAAELSGLVRVLAQGMAVQETQANDIILRSLETQVPERARLVTDSVRVQRQPGGEFSSGTVAFTMTVDAAYTTPIDPGEVRSAVAGLPPQAAAQLLQQRWLLTGEPEIYLDPAWRGVIPSIGSRIQVRVAFETEP